MIAIQRGQINTIMIPAEDLTIPAGVLVLCLQQSETRRKLFCEIASNQSYTDWHDFEVEEVAAGADPALGQVTARAGDYDLLIYSASSYTTTIEDLTLIHQERARVE